MSVPSIEPIRTLSKEHALKRVQLELLLETTPRDSRYSSELVEMMKREETLLSDSQSPSAATKDLIAKIERALAEETGRYFRKTASLNNKRWVGLMQNLERERERLKMEFFDRSAMLPDIPPITPFSVSRYDEVTEADLDAESARLEEEYNRNWLMYEGFHLNEAFQSQYQRVDKDWSVHEAALNEDYQNRRKQILGPEYFADMSDPISNRGKSGDDGNNGYDARWQHPEKQKTLIHTAPVLAPATTKKDGTFGGSAIKAIRASRSKEDNAELDRLERQLNFQLDALQRQKENALRWMQRQKIRLVAQAEAVQDERTQIADLIQRERHFYRALTEAVIKRSSREH